MVISAASPIAARANWAGCRPAASITAAPASRQLLGSRLHAKAPIAGRTSARDSAEQLPIHKTRSAMKSA
jgi:hypothetical protein